MFATSAGRGPRTSAGWLTVVGMHAPSALNLLAATPSPGTGSGAATAIGFALIATYLAGLVWLHRRRRRRRPARDVNPATASGTAAHRPPATHPPAESAEVAPAGDTAAQIVMPEPDRPAPAPPTLRL